MPKTMPTTMIVLLPLLAGLLIAGCGQVAGASTLPPPPTLPPAPPLSAEAAAALAEPLLPVPPAPAEPLVQADELLRDSFDAGLAGWNAVDFTEGPAGPATWQAAEGAVLQAGDALGLPDPGGAYLVAGEEQWRDYTLRAAAFARTPTTLGLAARRGEQGYYQLRLEAGEAASTLILEVVTADRQTRELARRPLPGAVGRWLALELTVRGTTISASLDGKALISATDGSVQAGAAALYAAAEGSARFDNVAVMP